MVQRFVVREGADLSRAIAEVRLSQGLTQQQLASATSVDRSWLARVEQGRTTKMVDLLIRVLRRLDATVIVEFDEKRPGDG